MNCEFLENEDKIYCKKYKREVFKFDCDSCREIEKIKKQISLTKKNNTRFKFRVFDYNCYRMYDWNSILLRFPNVNIFTCPYFKVMQYIDATDKDNVDIYEGDIVEVIRNNGKVERAIITFDSYLKGFILKPLHDWSFTVLSETKVIGNIYENPELIELFF